ncbi:MAG: hypothetical protein NC131_20790 [Roseburia sp.]|nr:hypothetical protein [Roseburia sp.]
MKIKKKTGALLIASAAVAAAGVAAVSFAAWTGTSSSLAAAAHTGTVSLFGFSESTVSFDKEIVPYNQPEGSYDTDTAATIISVALPSYSVYEDYTISVTSDTAMTFYVSVGAAQTTVPTGEPSSWNTAVWKQVTSSAEDAVFSFGDISGQTTVNGEATKTAYISLLLDSTDKDGHSDKDVNFTVVLNTDHS